MWPNPQFPADLVTFTEEIFNEKLHFLCSERSKKDLKNAMDAFNSPKNITTEPVLKHVMEKGKYYLALNSVKI